MAIETIKITYTAEPDAKGRFGYFLNIETALGEPTSAQEVMSFLLGAIDDCVLAYDADNEFEDTSEPEPYIQKELTKEEIDAKIIAVQKEIDMKLEKIFEKAKKR